MGCWVSSAAKGSGAVGAAGVRVPNCSHAWWGRPYP